MSPNILPMHGGVSHRITGFALVTGAASTSSSPAQAIVERFVGPYGGPVRTGIGERMQWALLPPGPEQVLATWSFFASDKGCCLIEGDFYAPPFAQPVKVGEDPGLARAVLEHVDSIGLCAALDELNGLFSGALVLPDGVLRMFVDPVGARMLYYRPRAAGGWEVASNVYGLPDLAPDPQGLSEHLFFGAPLQSGTIFRDVRLVPPGCFVECSGARARIEPYFTFPARVRRAHARGAAEVLASALDEHVRASPVEKWSLALSNGRDSRALLSAFVRTGIRPLALTLRESPSDRAADRAAQLAALAAVPHKMVERPEAWEDLAQEWALLVDGYGGAWGFFALALAAGHEGRPMATGFNGDLLSGGAWGYSPWKCKNARELADAETRLRGVVMSYEALRSCLRPDLLVSREALESAWRGSFSAADTDGDLLSAFMRHRFEHRNRRRAAIIFQAMRAGCVLVHPFADRTVLRAYLALPPNALVGQRAHLRVSTVGTPLLGRVPTGGMPLPLCVEMRVGSVLSALRHRFPPKKNAAPVPVNAYWRRRLHTAAESGLFNEAWLRSCGGGISSPNHLGAEAIEKMSATALSINCARNSRNPTVDPYPIHSPGPD